VATDASVDALAVARANAQRLGLGNVEFLPASWYDGVPDGRFDLIAANPPYVEASDPHLAGDVRFEPRTALVPAGDVLAALRSIIGGAPAHLVPGGTLVVEHGYDQQDAVRALLTGAGLVGIVTARDLAGIPRVAAGCAPN
jgi:release factor glutamine methyltransferase